MTRILIYILRFLAAAFLTMFILTPAFAIFLGPDGFGEWAVAVVFLCSGLAGMLELLMYHRVRKGRQERLSPEEETVSVNESSK
jgi:hypothetical protein